MTKLKKCVLYLARDPHVVYLFIMFFVTQLLYGILGLSFHDQLVSFDPFVIDGSARNDFWTSLYYYHLAPPLYILYALGFTILWPPNGATGFYILHTLLGLYAIYSLYKVQLALNVNSTLALLMTTIFLLSPSFNLVQTSGFYDFPTACLLMISAWRLVKLIENPRFSTAFAFFMVIALLANIRSLYHPLYYMLPLIVAVLFSLRKHWKVILLASLLPFFLVLMVYIKNYYQFHIFSTSSYLGETLDTTAMQFTVSLAEREKGIKEGFFSDLALCPSSADTTAKKTPTSKYTGFYCYSILAQKYRDAYIKKLGTDYKNVALLAYQPAITSLGYTLPHRNYLGNIGLSEEYKKNAIQAIIHYPKSYFASVRSAWEMYFSTLTYYFYYTGQNFKNIPVAFTKGWLRYPNSHKPFVFYPKAVLLSIILPTLFLFGVCFVCYSNRGAIFLFSLFALYFFTVKRHLFIHPFAFQIVTHIFYWALFFLALRGLLAWYKRKLVNPRWLPLIKPEAPAKQRIIVTYLLGNIFYTSIFVNFVVAVANERYRFYIDGLFLILASHFIQVVIIPLLLKVKSFLTEEAGEITPKEPLIPANNLKHI